MADKVVKLPTPKPTIEKVSLTAAKTLSLAEESIVAGCAAKIRELGERVLGDVIEIGRNLTQAKGIIGRGAWLPWLEREFRWSEMTATRFMRSYDFYELHLKSHNVLDLNFSVTALYELTKRRTPPEVRAHFIAKAKDGERVTAGDVKAARIPFPKQEPTASLPYEVVPSQDIKPPPVKLEVTHHTISSPPVKLETTHHTIKLTAPASLSLPPEACAKAVFETQQKEYLDRQHDLLAKALEAWADLDDEHRQKFIRQIWDELGDWPQKSPKLPC